MLQNVRARIRIPLEGRAVSWVKFRAFVPFTSSFPPHFLPPEPVSVTLWRDVQRVWVNLRCVLIPSERSSLRDWDLWGPFFFIITLALLLSSSATHNKAHVFAVVFGTVSAGAVVLTLNVQLLACPSASHCTPHGPPPHVFSFASHLSPAPLSLTPQGGRIIFFQSLSLLGYCPSHTYAPLHLTAPLMSPCVSFSLSLLHPSPPHHRAGRIIFFQSLSLLGYCLVPLDLAALLCLLTTAKLARMALVLVTFAWSSSAAYPFVAKAVPETRRVLAVYPVFLLYTAIGFLVLAND
ncbi:unnamed protein product [Closterium sp. NIES-65]|nr:unnamed protein product [Closterium sp. NIES-65]